MVIRSLATDLYRAQQRVHRLQEQLEAADLGRKEAVRRELLAATAERDQLRRLIDARKQKPPFRTSFKNEPDL